MPGPSHLSSSTCFFNITLPKLEKLLDRPLKGARDSNLIGKRFKRIVAAVVVTT